MALNEKSGKIGNLSFMTTTWMGNPDEELVPKYAHATWSANRTLLDPQIPSTQGGSEACNNHINK